MISGKVALGGLSLEFGNAQKRFDLLAKRAQELSASQAELLEEEREIFEELARLYLPDLSPESVSAGLRALQSRLREAVEEQRAHRARLQDELAALPDRMAALTAVVEASEAAEARAAGALDGVRASVEEELAGNAGYSALVEELQAVLERRALLKDRRGRLQAAANVERARYEDHAPFAYLRKRAFGEPEYRGGRVAGFFDGWLARRIDYPTLARNYRILRTGPHAIQAEIRRLGEQGAELQAAIDAIQDSADHRHGLKAALEAGAAAQERLVTDRAALAQAVERRDALAAEAREVEAHRGGPYEDAVRMHQDFLEGSTARDLLRMARETPDPRDDALVSRLESVRKRLEGVNWELDAQRKELEHLAGRTGSLADLARSAVKSFSSRRSYFSEDLRLDRLLASVLEGTTDAASALHAIDEAHAPRRVLEPKRSGPWEGWFAELSSQFDPELGAVVAEFVEDVETETEVIIQDADGRVIHRRVSRSGSSDAGKGSEGAG